ncbi:MAG TPA: NAD(P)-dependent oxidoreductase [Phnomibacter sp.]|nr:NAD(P)-dependent oxidoreductase [Phnomibacter sp.]
METIFITGACGFIGNAILRSLADRNCRVLAMSRNAEQDSVLRAHGAVAVRCDLDSVELHHLSSVTTIIYAAGAVGPKYSAAQFKHINSSLTIRLFQLAAAAGVKQFIYLSSDVVVLSEKDQPSVDETAPYSKLDHPYVQSKIAAEKFLVEKAGELNIQTICLRPRLVWGPGDKLQLPLMAKAVESGKFRWIDGGKCLTSATFIGNLCHAVLLCIGNVNIPSGAYFIADAEVHTQKFFWQHLLATKQLRGSEKSIPKWMAFTAARTIKTLYTFFTPSSMVPITPFSVAVFGTTFTVSCKKALDAFGYKSKYSFEQGLATMKND